MKVIQLTKGEKTLVDDQFYFLFCHLRLCCSVTKGIKYAKATVYINGGFVQFYLHRLVANPTSGLVVDHINRHTLDNRLSNLRCCSRYDNNLNRGARKLGSSKYKGVNWDKSKKRWYASIGYNGMYRNLGRYKTEQEAAEAYNRASVQFHGEFAFVNIIS